MENTNFQIELFKLYNGEYIIGEVTTADPAADATETVMKNPRQVIMMPTMSGAMSIALKPVCFPFTSKRLKDKFTVQNNQIMFTLFDSLGEIEKEIVDGYKSDISGIKIATVAETASIANGGDIIL